MLPIGPVTREELEAVKHDVDDLRAELHRVQDAMRHEVASGFDGVKRQLPLMVQAAVSRGLDQVDAKLDALILKAQEAEAYRALREKVEREVATNQDTRLDLALKREELRNKQLMKIGRAHV